MNSKYQTKINQGCKIYLNFIVFDKIKYTLVLNRCLLFEKINLANERSCLIL